MGGAIGPLLSLSSAGAADDDDEYLIANAVQAFVCGMPAVEGEPAAVRRGTGTGLGSDALYAECLLATATVSSQAAVGDGIVQHRGMLLVLPIAQVFYRVS